MRGGRARLRPALSMRALDATRSNPAMKAKYNALIAAGKHTRLATTAVMRQPIIIKNVLPRDTDARLFTTDT